MPVEDPATLPADPRKVPDSRIGIPVMIGTTADEATFLFRAAGRGLEPDEARLQAMVSHLPDVTGSEQAAVEIEQERARGAGDNSAVLCRLTTHHLFLLPVVEWTAARRRAGGEVLEYRVQYGSPSPVSAPRTRSTCRSCSGPMAPRSARGSPVAGSARRRRQTR